MGRPMKDSGVEWIGEIPEDWKVVQLGRIGKFSASGIDKKINENEVPVKIINYVDIYRNKEMKIDGSIDFMEVTTTPARRDAHLVEVGDVIFTPSSETIEEIGVSSVVYESVKNLSYSYHVLRFKPTIDLDLSFRKYMANNHLLLNYFSKRAVGTIRKTLNRSDFKLAPVVLPTRKEQEKIANFLDQKTSHIDSIIETTKNSIAAFKRYKQALITETVTKGLEPDVPMKDSGIEWIGMIPEHWESLRIKYASYLKGRIGWQGLTSEEYQDEGPYLITGKDFDKGRVNWETCTHITEERFDEAPDIHVKNGDLLITKDGTIGKVALISDLGEKASLNSGVLLIRKTKYFYDEKYLYYVLLSDVFWKWFNLIKSPNSTILHLYQNDFKDFSYPLPNISEQQQIVAFLDEKTAHIDNLIRNKEAMIEKLEAYKKSLIYEYVTGKKEVE